MRYTTVTSAMAGIALLALTSSAPRADAQPAWSDRTEFTFDGPVEVPGRTLPAGRYVFRLADSLSNRQTVQIWSADETKLMTTTLTIPASRLDATGDVVVRFASTPPGSPPAIKAWFYPGQTTGHAFVYPDEQARRIAKTTKTLVLSSDADPTDKTAAAEAMVAEISERGERRPFDPAGRYTTHEAPRVMAAPGAAAAGSGTVAVHGLEGDDLAEHYLDHIVGHTSRLLDGPGDSMEIRRADLERIHSDAQKAARALRGESS